MIVRGAQSATKLGSPSRQVNNAAVQPLPLGSSLDSDGGTFYWQPAAGFLGAYDLRFTPAGGVGPTVLVRAVVGPPIRAAIDTLDHDLAARQPFVVAGWALDLAAADGAGIAGVDVWARPASDDDPIFLGRAEVGGSRPDVAATYGARFEHSAFTLVAEGLSPGTFDIVVAVRRAETDSSDAALVERATVR